MLFGEGLHNSEHVEKGSPLISMFLLNLWKYQLRYAFFSIASSKKYVIKSKLSEAQYYTVLVQVIKSRYFLLYPLFTLSAMPISISFLCTMSLSNPCKAIMPPHCCPTLRKCFLTMKLYGLSWSVATPMAAHGTLISGNFVHLLLASKYAYLIVH